MPGPFNDLVILVTVFVTLLALLIFFRYVLARPAPQKKPLQAEAVKIEPVRKEIAFEFSGELLERRKYQEFIRYEPPIPWGYGETRITAMYRDPHWIYAYWEITGDKKEEVDRQFGPGAWDNSQPILRVYNVTGVRDFNGFNANSSFDIQISYYANNHYLEVGAPDETFCIDLARILPDGTFYTLARSNFVTTPRDRVSDVIDKDWPPIEELYAEEYTIEKITSPGLAKK